MAEFRRFTLWREVDESGVSGTGQVADGVVFPDGAVAVHWRGKVASTVVFASLEDAKTAHGHGEKTRFLFADPELNENGKLQDGTEDKATLVCCMCYAESNYVGCCFNCGAGGTILPITRSLLELLRKNASWVGKRFYATDEDREIHAELRALRAAIGRWPGRSAVLTGPLRPDLQDEQRWELSQELPNKRRVTTWVPRASVDETPEQAIARTSHLLPWWDNSEVPTGALGVFVAERVSDEPVGGI